MYQFGSYIQYLVAESAASIAFVCCNAMFATKAFNFDCLHTIYITTKVIITVVNAAMKRSTSTRKLSRKEPNFKLIFGFFYFLLFILFPHFLSVFVLGYQISHCFWGTE